MFSSPLSQDLVKAEMSYRLERTRRGYRTPTRRERAGRHASRNARRAVRYTKAA